MELEDQVCSLELAKKMKKLGFDEKSLYSWYILGVDKYPSVIQSGFENGFKHTTDKPIPTPAYTVAELGEMLPKKILDFGELVIWCYGELWDIRYINDDIVRKGLASNTEVDARAKMLIYLKESNLLT